MKTQRNEGRENTSEIRFKLQSFVKRIIQEN